MKQHWFWLLAALLVASQTCLLQRCEASASDCDISPRIIGAFGAENHAVPPVLLAADIRAQLPDFHEVRRVLNTNLAPSGERIVIYDSDSDASDPHPKVAFLVAGHLVKLFNGSDFAPRGGGFERYLSSCQFDLARNQKAFAIALSTAFDGTGSAFAIIKWQSGDYRVVFKRMVGQGRMEFGILKLELWGRSSVLTGRNANNPNSAEFECEWCLHRYVITEYLWRNGEYIKAGSVQTMRAYDPAEISGTPLSSSVRLSKGKSPVNR